MPASLTPLRRFAPSRHNLPAADQACAVDLPIPLPPATITTPWPPSRGGVGFELPSLDHLEAAVAAMDAGDRAAPPPRTLIEKARSEAFDAGLRVGAERRSWWDTFVGVVWGAAATAVLLFGSAAAGYLSVRTGQPEAEAQQPTDGTEPAPARNTWADKA